MIDVLENLAVILLCLVVIGFFVMEAIENTKLRGKVEKILKNYETNEKEKL